MWHSRATRTPFLFSKKLLFTPGELTSSARSVTDTVGCKWLRRRGSRKLCFGRDRRYLLITAWLEAQRPVGRLIHRPRRADILCTSFWRLSSTRLISPFSLGSFPTFIAASSLPLSLSLSLARSFSLPFSSQFQFGACVVANAMFFSKLVAIGRNEFHC